MTTEEEEEEEEEEMVGQEERQGSGVEVGREGRRGKEGGFPRGLEKERQGE